MCKVKIEVIKTHFDEELAKEYGAECACIFACGCVLCAYCDFAWNDMFVCVDICVCKARGCAAYICGAAWNLSGCYQ